MSYAFALGVFPFDQIDAAISKASEITGQVTHLSSGPPHPPFFDYGYFLPTKEPWGIWNRFAPYHPDLLKTLGTSFQAAQSGHDPVPYLTQAMAKLAPYAMRAMQDAAKSLPPDTTDEVGFTTTAADHVIDELFQVAGGLAYASVMGEAPPYNYQAALDKQYDALPLNARDSRKPEYRPKPHAWWRTGPQPQDRGGNDGQGAIPPPSASEIEKAKWALNVYSRLVPVTWDGVSGHPNVEQGLMVLFHDAMKRPLIDPAKAPPPPPPPPPPKGTKTTTKSGKVVLFSTEEKASPVRALLIGGVVAAAAAGAAIYMKRRRPAS